MTTEQKAIRFAAAVTLIGFGPVAVLSAIPSLSGPMAAVFDAVFWPIDGGETIAAKETRLLLAILGGITAGWGLMIWQLAGAPMTRDPESIRPILLNGIILWFLLDSAGSVLVGAPLNAVANVIIAAMFLVPILSNVKKAQRA